MCDCPNDFENPVPCPECRGTGVSINSYRFHGSELIDVEMNCPVCNGSGWMSQEDAEFYDFQFLTQAPQAFTPAEQTLFEDFPF
jgi:hypothetical protein